MKAKRKLRIAALALLAAAAAANAQQTGNNGQATAYLVSDAHLDTQWNWDIQTTIGQYVWNTIDQNLKLLEKYPDYVFNFEGGSKYAWMKEYYPREYKLMKEYIKSGRWHISGASWEANDAIVPSIESAIRNVMLGQEFYRNEFGVESTDIFLPDCFGFGWTLPSVAAHCGLIGFSSHKLGWRYHPFHGDKKYPYTIGLWRGVDGSEIMMAHGFNYGQRWKNEDLTQNRDLINRAAESPLGKVFHYYGTGDIGGSPSIQSVEAVCNAIGKNDGPVKILSVTSDQLFKDYQPYSSHPELPRYDGELLMDVHGTGCYTSQAAMKLYNRQNELLGDAAERSSVASEALGLTQYPVDFLSEAWRRFIFHQFHDDLTGTSIPRAYEFSWNDELLSLKQFSDVLTHSVGAVASQLDTRVKGTPVVLYNALGREATDLVELEVSVKGRPGKVQAYDQNGNPVAAQILGVENGRAKVLVEATVPANGYAVYDLRFSGSYKAAAPKAGVRTVGNSVYALTLDDKGDITSLVDKRNGKQLVADGKAIRLAIFTDNESYSWPAWEIIKKTVDAEPQSIDENVTMSVIEEGPVRTTLCVEKGHGDSKFRQYIRLYEGALADRIDFVNEVDWATTNALVKAEFPLTVSAPKATYDLGLGTIERGNNVDNAYEVYSQRWADLSDGNYGVTVMNDCKYGWDKPSDNNLRLTLLHTPKTKKSYAYQDHQDLGHHTFTYTLTGHSGAVDKTVASTAADCLNQRIKAFSVTKHAGPLGKSFSMASVDNKDLAMKALKRAQNGDEYVVRLYETAGDCAKTGKVTFARPIVAAVEADGTEKTIGNASFSGNTLDVKVGPFGMKTYKVKFAPAERKDLATYEQISLNYDKKCFSWNKFAQDADFCGGYSYAAELVPSSITALGVPFRLENSALLNGKACHGDTITLPEGNYNRLYILAATASEDEGTKGTFRHGKTSTELSVPSYTGFIGQWGHTGHTEGYMDADEVAYAGTHRHSAKGDHPYEFTYMYKYAIDLPAGTREVVLPDNPALVIFAATAANEAAQQSVPMAPLFRTAIAAGATRANADAKRALGANLLNSDMLRSWSGCMNDGEHPRFLTDGDVNTKWCDETGFPPYVEYDLGTTKNIKAWSITNAGAENPSYITGACYLQGRNSDKEEWKTIDAILANTANRVSRKLANPVDARYVRLLVTQPEQQGNTHVTRIYEFGVYE